VRSASRACLGLLLAWAQPAAAWTPKLSECLSRDARRLIPRTLAQLMNQRETQIAQELQRFPPELSAAVARDLQQGGLDAETLASLEAYAAEPVRLLKQQQVGEGVVRLAGLARIPADLADPALNAGAALPAGVAGQYYAFIEASLDKLPVTLEDPAALTLPRRELTRYWAGLVERSRPHASVLRLELFRDGRVVDHRGLDFRSPVYGVAQIAYSRAVTAIAATWSTLWREARGDMTRVPQPRKLAPLDRGPQEPIGPQSELLDVGLPRPARAARNER